MTPKTLTPHRGVIRVGCRVRGGECQVAPAPESYTPSAIRARAQINLAPIQRPPTKHQPTMISVRTTPHASTCIRRLLGPFIGGLIPDARDDGTRGGLWLVDE